MKLSDVVFPRLQHVFERTIAALQGGVGQKLIIDVISNDQFLPYAFRAYHAANGTQPLELVYTGRLSETFICSDSMDYVAFFQDFCVTCASEERRLIDCVHNLIIERCDALVKHLAGSNSEKTPVVQNQPARVKPSEYATKGLFIEPSLEKSHPLRATVVTKPVFEFANDVKHSLKGKKIKGGSRIILHVTTEVVTQGPYLRECLSIYLQRPDANKELMWKGFNFGAYAKNEAPIPCVVLFDELQLHITRSWDLFEAVEFGTEARYSKMMYGEPRSPTETVQAAALLNGNEVLNRVVSELMSEQAQLIEFYQKRERAWQNAVNENSLFMRDLKGLVDRRIVQLHQITLPAPTPLAN